MQHNIYMEKTERSRSLARMTDWLECANNSLKSRDVVGNRENTNVKGPRQKNQLPVERRKIMGRHLDFERKPDGCL